MEKVKKLTKKQIKKVIELKAGICEIPTCLETKGLVVHHIIRKCEEGDNNFNNLMVLCEKHHKQIHINNFKQVRSY